jgi:hypothetical protein
MEFLEKQKDLIMTYIPIGLLLIIFLGMLTSELSGLCMDSFFQPYTFGLENRIQVIG